MLDKCCKLCYDVLNISKTMKGSSRCREPFRELLGGAKQQEICIELAPELPSEGTVGQDGSPPL